MQVPRTIVFTEHAIRRCQERRINGSIIRAALRNVDLVEGKHSWRSTDLDLRVIYADDVLTGVRTIITAHRIVKDNFEEMMKKWQRHSKKVERRNRRVKQKGGR